MTKFNKKKFVLGLVFASCAGLFAAEADEFAGMSQMEAAKARLKKQQEEEAARRAAGSGAKDFKPGISVKDVKDKEQVRKFTQEELAAKQQATLQGKGMATHPTRKPDGKYRSWGLVQVDDGSFVPVAKNTIKKAQISAQDQKNVAELVQSAQKLFLPDLGDPQDQTERFPKLGHTCDLTKAFALEEIDTLTQLLLDNLSFKYWTDGTGTDNSYENGGSGLYCITHGDAHHNQTEIVPLTGIALRAVNNIHIPDYIARVAQYLPLMVKLLRMRGWAYDQLQREVAAGQLVLLAAAENQSLQETEETPLFSLAQIYGEISEILNQAKVDSDKQGRTQNSDVFDNSASADEDTYLTQIKQVVMRVLGDDMVPFSIGDEPKPLSEAKDKKDSAAAAASAASQAQPYQVPADAVETEDTTKNAFAKFRAATKSDTSAPMPKGQKVPALVAPQKVSPPAVAPKKKSPVALPAQKPASPAPVAKSASPEPAAAVEPADDGKVVVPMTSAVRSRRRQFKPASPAPAASQTTFVPVNPAPVSNAASPVPVQAAKTPSPKPASPAPAPALKPASPAASVNLVVPVDSLRDVIGNSYSATKTGFESDDE